MRRLTETKLFLDGGDPVETGVATQLLNSAGWAGLDGQTTNPSLVARNPEIKERVEAGEKLTSEELLSEYKKIVQAIEKSAPGDISIEVYADAQTSSSEMIEQAREFNGWISSAVIKLPIIEAGLAAAEVLKDEMKLNLTLCFSQQQTSAVYVATKDSKYPVFVSPFIGRLDDLGFNGLDLVSNIMRMLAESDGHVEVLTASVRSVEHILGALQLQTHALTMPLDKAFKPWAKTNFQLPDPDYIYPKTSQAIAYEELNLDENDWHKFNIHHDLTEKGLQTFAADWNSLLKDSAKTL